LVPTSIHTSRLVASRFQLDILQSTLLLIARTDSESAKLISSTIDTSDHPFIKGTTQDLKGKGLAEVLAQAEASGAAGSVLDDLEGKWMSENPLMTFDEGMEILSVSLLRF